MAKIKAQTLKGFRDFLPNETRKRQFVIDILKKVFELYGFAPMETPALEYAEVLKGKYGEEEKLIYEFETRGGDEVAQRYDQTVPLARVIAQYGNQLPMPFKRYQIQTVWRGENPQKGRFREFLQCDIDIVGSNSPLSDVEIIACSLESMKKLGFTGYSMRINDRNIFEDSKLSKKAVIELDKIDKEGPIVFITQLIREGKSIEEANKILNQISNVKKSQYIQNLFRILEELGYKEGRNYDFWFDSSLARGLDYYTGLIFELRIEKYGSLSVAGGGRYDNLIGLFAEKQIPAVGVAFGFDRIVEAMDELELFPKDLIGTKVLVTVFSPELLDKSIEIVNKLRSQNIPTELWLDPDSKLDKQLKYADQKKIPYVIIIGPDEVSQNKITLKNLNNKLQETITTEELAKNFNLVAKTL